MSFLAAFAYALAYLLVTSARVAIDSSLPMPRQHHRFAGTLNLAAAPELRQGERGPYTYARVIVSDRIRQEDGSYTDGPPIAYDVAVSGAQATALVETAERSGNVRVTFAGRYRVTEYRGEQGTRI